MFNVTVNVFRLPLTAEPALFHFVLCHTSRSVQHQAGQQCRDNNYSTFQRASVETMTGAQRRRFALLQETYRIMARAG